VLTQMPPLLIGVLKQRSCTTRPRYVRMVVLESFARSIG
jgi:hypothetical protein